MVPPSPMVYQLYQPSIDKAAAALAAQQQAAGTAAGTAVATATSIFDIPAGKGWYQTWWGMGALGVAGIGALITVYKLVT